MLQAKNHYQDLIDIYKSLHDTPYEEEALISLAEIYNLINDHKQAIEILASIIEMNGHKQEYAACKWISLSLHQKHFQDLLDNEEKLFKILSKK